MFFKRFVKVRSSSFPERVTLKIHKVSNPIWLKKSWLLGSGSGMRLFLFCRELFSTQNRYQNIDSHWSRFIMILYSSQNMWYCGHLCFHSFTFIWRYTCLAAFSPYIPDSVSANNMNKYIEHGLPLLTPLFKRNHWDMWPYRGKSSNIWPNFATKHKKFQLTESNAFSNSTDSNIQQIVFFIVYIIVHIILYFITGISFLISLFLTYPVRS